jgi:uncharacterized membrane protein
VEPIASAEQPAAARTSTSTLAAALALIVGAIGMLWFAPGSYEIYLALHVLAIVIWVGGDITLTTLGIVLERRRDGEMLAALGKMGAWIGVHIYTPALFAAFAFGVALIEKGDLGWTTLWLDLGLAGWAIAAIVGVGFVGPELGRIDRAAQQLGPESEEVQRRVRRLFTVFRFDTALLILIVLDMTAKPSL